MTKKQTSIRIDIEIMNDFIGTYLAYETQLNKTLGVPRTVDVKSLSVTDLVHLALKSATDFYEEKAREMIVKDIEGKIKE